MIERLLHGMISEEKVRSYCRDLVGSESQYRVWVHPMYIKAALGVIKDSSCEVAAVIDFPLGASTVDMKVAQAVALKEMGVDGLGLMVFHGHLKGDLQGLSKEVDEVKAAVGSTPLQLVVDPTPLSEKQVEAVVEFAKKQKLPLLKLAHGFVLDGYTVKI